MKTIKASAIHKISDQWIELTGKPLATKRGLDEIVSLLEEKANSGDSIQYEVSSYITLSHRPEHIELAFSDFDELAQPPAFTRTLSHAGDILRGYFTASDGIEYRLETDPKASEYLAVIGPDGSSESFDLASRSNFSAGVQWTAEWTQADWDAVNAAIRAARPAPKRVSEQRLTKLNRTPPRASDRLCLVGPAWQRNTLEA